MQTLRAKGLGRVAVLRHAVRNALPQVLAVMGLQFGYLVGGSILIETIFTWPGTGFLLSKAILTRDIPMLQGAMLDAGAVLRRHQPDGRSAADRDRSPDQARLGRSASHGTKRRSPIRDSARAAKRRRSSRRGSGYWRNVRPAAALRLRHAVLPRGHRADRAGGDLRAAARAVRSEQDQHDLSPEADRLSRSSCSAPTSSAATCSRASSTARACR